MLSCFTYRFFVCVFVYLVVGFLILRFGRGARGWEQIPNYEFWLELPGLVKVQFKNRTT